jgi:hypothetical protein
MTLLPAAHRRRLREMWRSAGWPCRDAIEIDLLAAGLLERQLDEQGRETLRVTDAGVALLAATLNRNRAAFGAHEALVARVAQDMQRSGRVVWRGLSLRAPLATEAGGTRWVVAMPDVFSIRHTTVEDFAEPVVHEIKVRRADLLADLRRADKGGAYRALSSQCWYVLGPGVGTAADVPEEFGVMQATQAEQGLEVLRPAPRRALRVPFPVWMALARANAQPLLSDDMQAMLGAPPVPPVPPLAPGESGETNDV